ncbi:MAG: GNAT family N-acetyltransferase [Halodesulfurarchaeum sp.]
MHIRDAKKHEEVWLLDRLEEFGFEDSAFRSRDYVFAIEEEIGKKTGFGRLRVHSLETGKRCELAHIGVLPDWRGQGVGAHILERLTELARDQNFETVVSFSPVPQYCSQFGFVETDPETLSGALWDRFEQVREGHPDAVPMVIETDEFEMPPRLRRRFHDGGDDEERNGERPEDFGIDPRTASYKYDTGRRDDSA